MPVIIKLTFPAGRYHATPWGRHVNEGVPEWPPSPWRLLRALVAVWKRTCADVPEPQIRRILELLAQAPRFQLPPHRVAHTRHYMPWEKKGPADRTLVFDTFVSVCRHDPLLIGWTDVEMSADDRAVLAQLLANLSSLGRAEGWVKAELLDGIVELPLGPAEASDLNPVPVFCLDPATAFSDQHYPTLDAKKLAKGKLNPSEFLFDCPRWHLCLDTETVHSEKWPTVPGSKWVNYTRPTEAIIMPAALKQTDRHTYTVARLRLDARVLPLITETLPLAEAFRCELMRKCRYVLRIPKGQPGREELSRHCSSVTGKDEAGQPLKGHKHAFFLVADEDGDGRIDHITVLAARTFSDAEVQALDRLRELPLEDGNSLRFLLIGLGKEADFRTTPLLEESTVWTSATPFVVTRYPKLRGTKRDRPEDYASPRDFARHVLRQELERRPQLPKIVSIEDHELIGRHRLRSIQFKRFRSKRSDDGGRRPASGFRITFAAPLRGPLCLGHSCHFGLGLFLPERAQTTTETKQ